MDARLAWYSVGSNTTQLDSDSSSYSLLHSIYGSQVSQLPFSDYDSETSLTGTQSEHYVPPHLSPPGKRRLSRPKSSPANVITTRQQLQSAPRLQSRPGSALIRSQRPGSATHRVARGRPGSAAVRRPSSAATSPIRGRASPVRGGASPTRRRPKTAMSYHSSSSSTLLLDLEEEDDTFAPIIRETAPVQLTHTPEYFGFWQGKPLKDRDHGVKVQKRKAWTRPKSDYGNRFLNRSNKDKENDGRDGGSDGIGGLETLLERDGDSRLSSRRGSRDVGGHHGDGEELNHKNKTDGADVSKLSVTGEGVTSRRGSRDNGGKDGNNKQSLKDGSGKFNKGLTDRSGSHDTSSNQGDNGRGKTSGRSTGWGNLDEHADADNDDYFRNSGNVMATLPTIPNTNSSITSQPETNQNDKLLLKNKENFIPVRNTDKLKRGRIGVKYRSPVEHLPTIINNDRSCRDYQSSKALAATSWMEGSGSSNTTRFELPMNLKTLEGMSPQEYLSTHCIISKRRMVNSSKIFTKLDKDRTFMLSTEDVKKGLILVHHNCITEDQASSVINLLQLSIDQINLKLFAAICCFAERMLNLFFLPTSKKDLIETVDFEALDWKLRNCIINIPLRAVFTQL